MRPDRLEEVVRGSVDAGLLPAAAAGEPVAEQRMHYGNCSIYMLDADKAVFHLEATNNPNDLLMLQSMPQDSDVGRRLCETMEPYLIHDYQSMLQIESPNRAEHESGIVVPIIREERCIGGDHRDEGALPLVRLVRGKRGILHQLLACRDA